MREQTRIKKETVELFAQHMDGPLGMLLPKSVKESAKMAIEGRLSLGNLEKIPLHTIIKRGGLVESSKTIELLDVYQVSDVSDVKLSSGHNQSAQV